jgi:hypothetical protein
LSLVGEDTQMYGKILGLKRLEKMGFPVPRYQVIAIDEDEPQNIEEYVKEKIKKIEIPQKSGDSIGVTIRISLPMKPDRAKHRGLHNVDSGKILQKVLDAYKEYGTGTKIILQYTIDAKCSGAVIEDKNIIIEAIPGDAPPLLEGTTRNVERWIYETAVNKIHKDQSFLSEDGKESAILSSRDLNILKRYVKRAIDAATGKIYLEWSMSKNGQIYFYEYGDFA